MNLTQMPEWATKKAPDGRIFYNNSATKQSAWKKLDENSEEKLPPASMEVEDSGEYSEEDDFRLVGGSNRRKVVTIGDSQVEQNLLSRNKFSPLVENNNNNHNNADPAAGKATPTVTTPGKKAAGEKQPPLVVKNTSCSTLRKIMKFCSVKPLYKLTRWYPFNLYNRDAF